ncbi:hypothetical protein QTH87_04750 [Variovorax sp. J22P168]|uniref:hypothetical protein n=1 Tax=Variovorax jilinensis TaxID=3053513 RepID=UPI00257704BF|nr:hypothetical protein [Variovorax sp. J22P168]MDM0011741.1 hypothetical protein [Variovorax sp. J22P168]
MHDIRIGSPRDMQATARPVLLQRSDEDFIQSTLDELRSAEGRQALATRRARAVDGQGTLKLFQPIQRQFHLALIEAWCDTPGGPRIDPSRVDSAGLVVRRLDANGQPQGWMRSNGRVRGWVPLTRVGSAVTDPMPKHRLQRRLTGVADIDRQLGGFALQQPDNLLEEDVVPMFIAPPDVCADAGKSVFYGMVPTVSSELSEAPPAASAPDAVDFGPDSSAFRTHLVAPLRGLETPFPFAGATVAAGWFDASEAPGAVRPADITDAQFAALSLPLEDSDTPAQPAGQMRVFLLLLRQLASEFNAFDGGAEADALRHALAAVQLPLVLREGQLAPDHVRADIFLSDACKVLLKKEAVAAPLEMPERWPALDEARTRALAQAMHSAMQARAATLMPQSGRYDEPGARYQVRAFVRIKAEGACPVRIVWSQESEPFVIAPWYESADARPPVQIPLPDASDRHMLRQLKPNVAFVVPPSMQNLLSGKAKDLMEGKASTGSLGISWICGFNIPVITICAFIVLNIFLTLFNLIFGWLFFIKICVPFPKLGNKAPAKPPFST